MSISICDVCLIQSLKLTSTILFYYLFFFSTGTTTNFQEVAKPELKIIEQPKTIFRFRYETEMQGPHGMIQAKPHNKNQKVYPTVKLLNAESFDDQTKFLIKCSLYQFEPNEEVHALHPHKLIMRVGDVENCDPHYIEVSKQNDYTAV